ncbi:hypothetical protein N7532_008454 [Penicillium argentinense]|uniref:Zn(2)-C6 fungal-type domain-containing protein n=1 Tax=Penicillium argentinense TaxID=1131581 RepID=A0A9W9EXP8_9EURO|nr:uncharacterized protein N7532_008454 [Penicillium argentinense]KAJ5089770.1 hypothetical protein N7532_008454 [Penicillium argentinense]
MTTPANGRATRSSLACLPCRSRHLKCDGKRPCCSRCAEAAQDCHYARSRRGGLDRAALAERRKRLAGTGNVMATLDNNPNVQGDSGAPTQPALFDISSYPIDASASLADGSLLDGVILSNAISNIDSPGSTASFQVTMESIEKDTLIDSYYKSFHKFHPFLLPRRHMIRHYQDPSKQANLRPLIAAMRLIGYIYSFREWSASLKDHVETCFAQATLSDPVMAQGRLLYSIALFWYDHKNHAKTEIDAAIRLALDLHLFQEEVSAVYGADDPVLRESWRRTWWMLYTIDAYYAGTLGTMEFQVVDVDATVGLPCEEQEYESGVGCHTFLLSEIPAFSLFTVTNTPLTSPTSLQVVPDPKTLQDFDCREFAAEDAVFSSFAYLVGAVRCVALAISTVPKHAVKEDSTHVIQAADSALDGWLLLLPKDRKQVLTKTGEIDELMFQAHLLIHVATIGIHRPLSDLKFNPVEDVSSCARQPPPDTPIPELVNVHTVRVLRAVEAQIRLLALPVRPFRHTPFTTCMISEGTLALLSACHFLLKGSKLAIARDQIRMTIGCLKALGEYWPRTARNVREIQTIAHHVLRLGSRITSSNDTPKTTDLPQLSDGDGQGSFGSEGGTSSNDTDILPLLGSIDDLCGWYNIGDLGPDVPWEMESSL